MYMNTAVINLKIEPKVKFEAQKVASDLGFSLSSLINGYLRQLVKTKAVHFSLSDESEIPNRYLLEALKEAENDRQKGRFKSFTKKSDALSYLDRLVDDNKKN